MSSLLKNSMIYTVVSLLQKASSFFLLPLFTLYLSREDYGVFALVNSLIMLFSTLFTFQLRGAITRYTVKYFLKEPDRLKRMIGSCVYFTLSSSVILTCLFASIYTPIVSPFIDNISFYPYAFLGFISILFSPLFQIYQAVLQAKQLGKIFGRNNLLYAFTNIILGITFIIIFKMKAEGLLLALAITNVLFSIFGYLSLKPMMIHGIFKRELKEALKYSIPLIPHGVLTWVTTMVDRLVLTNLAGIASTGLYAISFQASSILNLFSSSIHQAYTPWFYKKYEEGDSGLKQINSIALSLSIWYSFLAFGMSLFARELVTIMTAKEFFSSWIAIPALSFSFAFNGSYFTFCNVLFIDKTKYVSWVTLSTALANLGLNFLLIPSLGIFGASIAALCGKIILLFMTIYFSYKIGEKRISYFKIALSTFLYILLFFPIFYFEYTGINIPLSLKILAFFLILALTIYFTSTHFLNAIHLLKNKLGRNSP